MVYGVIDKKSKSHYTYLIDIFDAINNKQVEFNWLITDSEIVAHSYKLNALYTDVLWQYENGKPNAVSAPDHYFISGEELTEIIKEDDSQWIWGVLSGFDRAVSPEEILKYSLPKTNGYEGFWNNPPAMQHTLATIEIVPCDSSCILFLSKEKEIIDDFKKAYPACQDLSEYNT